MLGQMPGLEKGKEKRDEANTCELLKACSPARYIHVDIHVHVAWINWKE